MKSKTFQLEEEIKKLELIVNMLEEGDSNIDELLVKYEEGVKIIKQCREYLSNAELKVIEIGKAIVG